MRIYFSEGEACLDASSEEYANLKVVLDNFISSQTEQLIIDTDNVLDPHPYALVLDKLMLIKSDSALRIYMEQLTLFIEGSDKHIALLALNLPQNVEETSPDILYHIHFDHAGWPNEVAADSLDLILCTR